MASFALIACDHGFGHVRRVLLIGKELAVRDQEVTVFAAPEAVARFASHHLGARITIVPFHTNTTPERVRSGASGDWGSRLPPLDEFDIVVSDNLIEVLDVRPDAVLSGSFLWHLVLEGVAPAVHAASEARLSRHRPSMLASTVFGMPDLAARTRVTTVGMCAALPRPLACGSDLLIACGGSHAMEDAFRELIAKMTTADPPPFPVVWVEPRLLPAAAPLWMRPATFAESMYSQLLAVVCRPGVGTLTDCAWARARAFMASESGNAELAFNARRFAELGIGDALSDPREAFTAACAFSHDSARRARHASAVGAIDFDGAAQTATLLIGMAAH